MVGREMVAIQKKNHFGIIQFKNSLRDSEPFQNLNIRKRGINSVTLSELQKVNTLPLLSTEKKRDLISMLNLIDPCYHDFYKSLKSADGIPNVDPDIVEENFIENVEN